MSCCPVNTRWTESLATHSEPNPLRWWLLTGGGGGGIQSIVFGTGQPGPNLLMGEAKGQNEPVDS